MSRNPQKITASNYPSKKDHWSRHPLLVAVVSYGLLALAILFLGNHFQREHFLYQKKAELTRDIFYNLTQLNQEVWNVYFAGRKRQQGIFDKTFKENYLLLAQEGKESALRLKEVIARSASLTQELKIYFGVGRKGLVLHVYSDAINTWQNVVTKMQSLEWSGRSTEDILSDYKKMEAEINSVEKEVGKKQEIILLGLSTTMFQF